MHEAVCISQVIRKRSRMTPITRTIEGRPYSFLLTSAALGALNAASVEVAQAFRQWASAIEASSPAATSSIDPKQIRAVLAAALVGGGMDAQTATDTAERIHRNQLNRAMDFLAAQIVKAAIAAG